MTEYLEKFYCRVNNSKKIEVSVVGEVWVATSTTRYAIDFGKYDKLPVAVIKAAKLYLRQKLSSAGPSCIDGVRNILRFLSDKWSPSWSDFSSIKLIDWMALWNSDSKNMYLTRNGLKSMYGFCSENFLLGAEMITAAELRSWTSSKHELHYKDILTWHEERGAMNSPEQERLLRELKKTEPHMGVGDLFSRILILAAHETLKRPCQLKEMKRDALVVIQHESGNPQYFLRIPKVKMQTGRKAELWPISNYLGELIKSYSAVEKIGKTQVEHDLLLVNSGVSCWFEPSLVVKRWCAKRNIISPRTGKPLVLTLYRLRHSGATALAMQGVASSEIQYILEHDSPFACQAYIDAIGSELAPALEKVNRKLGNLFSTLNESFFKGHIVDELVDRKILIPLVEVPAVVGSCGFKGTCDKHPFLECYNGCQYFLAWRNADHRRALKYVEEELSRWEKSEAMHDRSKAIKDFERIVFAIKNVISRI